MDRYTLVATKVAPAGMAQGRVPDFAGAIPPNTYTDPGRRWAGDLYDTGPVSDPDAAFAHFGGAEEGADTEGWLDKAEDGTLIGWVRQGKEVWRYTDPHTWASDVDAAQMTRLDAPSPGELDAAAAAPAEPDDTTMPANQTSSDFGPDTPDEENPFLDHDAEDLEAEAVETNTAAGDEQAAAAGESPIPQDPNVDPNVEPDAEADPVTDPAAEPVTDPAVDAEVVPEGEVVDPADEEDDEDDKTNPFAKTEKKHMPGHHNQEEHGNWADGIHPVDRIHLPSMPPAGTSTAASPSPKAPEPAAPAPAKPSPAKASVGRDALEHLSVAHLEGIWAGGEQLYDQDTLSAVAQLLDEKNPLDEKVRADLPEDTAGRAGVFAGIVPDHYVAWVARNNPHAPKVSRNKQEQIKEAYSQFVEAQYQQAEDATRGHLWSNAGKAWARTNSTNATALFDGRLQRTQVRKYASEELLRWFAEHPRLTFQQFAAEFYPSYAAAVANSKNAYLSEHG